MAKRQTEKSNGTSEALATSAGASMLARLREGTDARRELHWPGAEGERFYMNVLSCDEVQEAQSAALERWNELDLGPLTPYTADDFYSEVSTQLLARSMRTIDDPKRRLFADANELRSLITADERTMLTTYYIEIQSGSNPDETAVSPSVIQQVRDAIKKKDVIQLSAFGSVTLALYLLSTASPPAS